MKTTVKELQRINKKVHKYSALLSFALQELSRKASEIYGEELSAEICGGEEVEFRRIASDGVSDPFSCIPLEQILEKLEQTRKTK